MTAGSVLALRLSLGKAVHSLCARSIRVISTDGYARVVAVRRTTAMMRHRLICIGATSQLFLTSPCETASAKIPLAPVGA